MPSIRMMESNKGKWIQVAVRGRTWLIEGVDEGWAVTRMRSRPDWSDGAAEVEEDWVIPYRSEPEDIRAFLYEALGLRYGNAVYRRLTDLLVR